MAAASVDETKSAIDSALRAHGQPYSEYSCKRVSWDDVSRGTVGSQLSCWGPNITDTYLKGRDGQSLYTVRSDNWNERLGIIDATKLTFLHGNCDIVGAGLKPVTLQEFLSSPGLFGAEYSGLPYTDLSNEVLDKKVSIRFQTVFLPVGEEGTYEFATEAYNYNTLSDSEPRNVVLLCTSQGTAVQADGRGAKKLLHHARKKEGEPVRKFWLEAERTKHSVGGPQKETAQERQDAERRGKATAERIGIEAMGERFNVLMTVQIPLKRKPRKPQMVSYFGNPSGSLLGGPVSLSAPVMKSRRRKCVAPILSTDMSTFEHTSPAPNNSLEQFYNRRQFRSSKRRMGMSNAARVSRGSDAGAFEKMKLGDIKRNEEECVTVTVVFYNTVSDGVPGEDDVVSAIDDIEQLYKACEKSGKLGDQTFDYAKKALTVDDLVEINEKITTQHPDKNDETEKIVAKIEALKNNLDSLTEVKLLTVGLMKEKGCDSATVGVVTKKFEKVQNSGGSGAGSIVQAVDELRLVVTGGMHEVC